MITKSTHSSMSHIYDLTMYIYKIYLFSNKVFIYNGLSISDGYFDNTNLIAIKTTLL